MKLSGVQYSVRMLEENGAEVGEWTEWHNFYEEDMFTAMPGAQIRMRVTPGLVQDAVRKTKAELKAVVRAQLKNVSEQLSEI